MLFPALFPLLMKLSELLPQILFSEFKKGCEVDILSPIIAENH